MSNYNELEIQIVYFNCDDVVRTSNDNFDFGEEDKTWEGI